MLGEGECFTFHQVAMQNPQYVCPHGRMNGSKKKSEQLKKKGRCVRVLVGGSGGVTHIKQMRPSSIFSKALRAALL
jgi:hypothetical protein